MIKKSARTHEFLIRALCFTLLLARTAQAAPKSGKSAAHGPVAERPERAKILAAHAQVVVTVKFLLKVKSPKGPDRSIDSEAPCVLLDPQGLVLCSNTQLGSISAAARRLGAAGYSASASDLKVLIGDDTEGLPAQLIARDSELDLAWLQIKDAAGKTFASIDLGASAQPQLGDELLILARAAKFLGRVPLVEEAEVVGATDRPRSLILIDGTGGNLCAPVFNNQGQFVGVTIMQLPDDADARLRSGATPGIVFPVHDLAQATKRARDQAARDELPKEEAPATAAAKEGAAVKDAAAPRGSNDFQEPASDAGSR